MMQPTVFGVIELFAGAGGLVQGFQSSGRFQPLLLTDIDENAATTFRHNFPEIRYLSRDVCELNCTEILDIADGRSIHGILGGPPCQGFSLNGKREKDDKRNDLTLEYAKLVGQLKPAFMLMENVPQALFHRNFRQMLDALSADYRIAYAVLNAAQFGAPQTRHRAFVLAYRRDLELDPVFPSPTHGFVERPVFNYCARRCADPVEHSDDTLDILGADPVVMRVFGALAKRKGEPSLFDERESVTLSPLITVNESIGDLTKAPASVQDSCPAQRVAETGEGAIANHVHRAHMEPMLRRVRAIPEGGDLSDVDDRSLLPKSHYSQAYGRLHRQGLARTITTFFPNAGSGRFLHPTLDRTLTIREAARLQTFPDSFKFLGTQAEQARLIGNAVPPRLAEAIARKVASALDSRPF
jgi:DNA (cytosine-5)-methyltransferase 1